MTAADQSPQSSRAYTPAVDVVQLLDGARLLAWLDERAITGAVLPAVIYGAAAVRIRRGDFNAEVQP